MPLLAHWATGWRRPVVSGLFLLACVAAVATFLQRSPTMAESGEQEWREGRVATLFGPRERVGWRNALRIGPYLRVQSPMIAPWSITGMDAERSMAASLPGSPAALRTTAADVPWLRHAWTTGPQRFLLIGDSEAGGLMQAMNDYAVANGHTLSAVFTWFSATSINFGLSTRVDSLLLQHRPTMVIVVLGMNELYARDLAPRLEAARRLRDKIGHLPYLWVGPANFDVDYGINAVFEEAADPGRFYRSADLPLTRGSDGRHPDMAGYRLWMDSIAGYMIRQDAFRFAFAPPRRRGNPFKGTLVMANAVKDRGY